MKELTPDDLSSDRKCDPGEKMPRCGTPDTDPSHDR